MALINPLHAVDPVIPQENSPYSPGSRAWRNPLYLDVEHVAGAAGADPEHELLSDAGRALNSEIRIDRDAVFRLKMRALETLWHRLQSRGDVQAFKDAHGEALVGFATFNALVEEFGAGWRDWPTDYKRPDSEAVRTFRARHSDRIDFHVWLQSLLDHQLEEASHDIGIVHDLAIGVGPDGADAWTWQDTLATGTSVGAPPDAYNVDGQDWGVLGFDPNALAKANFEPFIQTVRSAMRHAGGIRFDHVMGLFRLYWVPDGFSADQGAYVTYPSEVLLDILALESQRSGAYVIGEDLGTVAPGVREEMARRKMLSYKLLWFEDGDPREWPSLSLAAATNHDLPTTAGLWTGADAEAVRTLGRDPNQPFLDEMTATLMGHTGLDRTASVAQVVERSYGEMAAGASAIVTAQLEDPLEVTQRYNQPGTMGEWNWSATLPEPLEEVLADKRVVRLAQQLSEARPRPSS
jgi:4-alpha-glucanotransferase